MVLSCEGGTVAFDPDSVTPLAPKKGPAPDAAPANVQIEASDPLPSGMIMAQIPGNGSGGRALVPIDDPAFERVDDGAFQVTNPVHGLAFFIDAAGMRVSDDERGWSWQYRLLGMRRGGFAVAFEPRAPSLERCTKALGCNVGLVVEHPRVREWYVNTVQGMAQALELADRPAGDGTLIIRARHEGPFYGHLRDGGFTVAFEEQDELIFTHASPLAVDDTGANVPAQLEVEGDEIHIRVDDSDAVYPLRIDLDTGRCPGHWCSDGDPVSVDVCSAGLECQSFLAAAFEGVPCTWGAFCCGDGVYRADCGEHGFIQGATGGGGGDGGEDSGEWSLVGPCPSDWCNDGDLSTIDVCENNGTSCDHQFDPGFEGVPCSWGMYCCTDGLFHADCGDPGDPLIAGGESVVPGQEEEPPEPEPEPESDDPVDPGSEPRDPTEPEPEPEDPVEPEPEPEDPVGPCADNDFDGLCDADDADDDNDGCLDVVDPQPLIPSFDLDGDGLGNVCDPDDDGDGCPDGQDLQPLLGSFDLDGDGIANDCDADDDDDGCLDSFDPTPMLKSPDLDGDGLGNDCDIDDDGDGCPDVGDPAPWVGGPDTDGDGQGDQCDLDDDGDGCVDLADPKPLIFSVDYSGNGLGQDCDPVIDADGDGCLNWDDQAPLDPSADIDEDQIADDCDACIGKNWVGDLDGDGLCDDWDDDDDGDTCLDVEDAAPKVPGTLDVDGDGVPLDCDRCIGFDNGNDSDDDGICDDLDPKFDP